MLHTFCPTYCKQLPLRNCFQLTETEFDDDLFVFSQFYSLNETNQNLPAGVGGTGSMGATVQFHIFHQKLCQSSFPVLHPLFLMLLNQIQLCFSSESSFIGMIGLPLLFPLVSLVHVVHHAEAFVPLND